MIADALELPDNEVTSLLRAAMLHDILITVGIYSLVFKEVTVDTVAAVGIGAGTGHSDCR